MRRNVKIVLLLSCAWMSGFVYYYHATRDSKVRAAVAHEYASARSRPSQSERDVGRGEKRARGPGVMYICISCARVCVYVFSRAMGVQQNCFGGTYRALRFFRRLMVAEIYM